MTTERDMERAAVALTRVALRAKDARVAAQTLLDMVAESGHGEPWADVMRRLLAERAPLEARLAELESEVSRRRDAQRAATQRLVETFGADRPYNLEDAVERAVSAHDAFGESIERALGEHASDELAAGVARVVRELERVRVDLAAERRAAREREAPPAEPARPLAVGDRVRVVRCCDRPCDHGREGYVSSISSIDDEPSHEGSVWLDGGRMVVNEVERVEPASEPAPAATSRVAHFNAAGGAISWNGRPFSRHPDRCECQGSDPFPHRHYDDAPHSCARCGCSRYTPAVVAEPGASESPEPAPAAERPLTHEGMARLLRAVLEGAEPDAFATAAVFREVARRLEVRDA